MNRLIYLTSVIAIALVSCEKAQDHVYEDDINSKAYFTQAVSSSLLVVKQEDLAEDGTLPLCVYNAGNNSHSINIDVIVDQDALDVYNVENTKEYKILPEKYYQLTVSHLKMDTDKNYQQNVSVFLDFAAFSKDGLSPKEYLLPLSLSAKDANRLSFDYKTILLQMDL